MCYCEYNNVVQYPGDSYPTNDKMTWWDIVGIL